jgi:hypothetical protein
VRVVNIAINRYGKKNKYADENVNNLKELDKLFRILKPEGVLLDQDDTYAKCPLKKSLDYNYKNSFMNRFGRGRSVMVGFGLFTLLDIVFSAFRINPRSLFNRSEDHPSIIFNTLDKLGSNVIITTLCNKRTVKRLLRKAGYLKYFQN